MQGSLVWQVTPALQEPCQEAFHPSLRPRPRLQQHPDQVPAVTADCWHYTVQLMVSQNTRLWLYCHSTTNSETTTP